MRVLMRLIGAGMLAGLIIVTVILWRAMRGAGELDREARAYADDTLRAITTQWDMQEARRRETERMREAISDARLADKFAVFESLGPLVSRGVCTGGTFIVHRLQGPISISGRYECPARYREGNATVIMQLVKQTGTWRIDGFTVQSEMLAKLGPSLRI